MVRFPVVTRSLGVHYRVRAPIHHNLFRLDVEVTLSRKRYRLRPRSPLASAPASSVPGVSILRPLKGLDANLYENLESTFIQEYPNYEILFSVADEYDQALAVVRDLMEKYPNVKAKVIVGMCLTHHRVFDGLVNLTELFRGASGRCQSQSKQPHPFIP